MDMLGLAGRTRDDLRRCWRLMLGWQLLAQLLGLALAAPLAGWLLDRVVARSGSVVVSNFDLAWFVLSPRGAVFVVLAVVSAIAFHMAQFAGHTWIAGHAISRQPLTFAATLGAVWLRLARLTRIGLRMFVRLLWLTLPFFVVLGVLWLASLREHDVSHYLTERPPEWRRATTLLAVLGVGYAFVVLRQFARWIYTMPLAMFDATSTPREVLATSERMLQGVLLVSIAPLVIWWLGLGTVTVALFWLGRRFTSIALEGAGTDLPRILPLVALFLGVSVVCSFMYSTLQFGVHQLLITRLYAERRDGSILLAPACERAAEVNGRRAGWSLLLALVVFAALSFMIASLLVVRLDLRGTVAVTAHRGASRHAPENTLGAIREAYAAGADYVELDVQRTQDGAIVAIHDADLMRMAGDPRRVRDLTLAELQRIDVGAHGGAGHTRERAPTLAEAIDCARGRLRLHVELRYHVPDAGLAPAVVEQLRNAEFVQDAIVTSLDPAALRQVEELAPELRTGLIVTAAVANVAAIDADFLILDYARAEAALVRRAQAAGKAVHVWTPNDPEVMWRMVERSVDNVITDDPATLVRILRQRDASSSVERLAFGLRALFMAPPPQIEAQTRVTVP